MSCSCGSDWDENGVCKRDCVKSKRKRVFKEESCMRCGVSMMCATCGLCMNCEDGVAQACCKEADELSSAIIKGKFSNGRERC